MAAEALLRKHQVAVQLHLEHPTRRLDELHVGLRVITLDLGRQTGGPGLVPSDATILNRNLHARPPGLEGGNTEVES